MPVDIVEMFWRCTHCRKTNLGRYKECTADKHGIGCGKPKSETCEEWLPDDVSHTSAHVVTESTAPGLLGQFKAGADVPCPFCDSLQWMVNGTCTNCTAPMDRGRREVDELRTQSEDSGRPVTRVILPPAPPPRAAPVRSYDVDDDEVRRTERTIAGNPRGPWLVALGIGAGVVALSGALYMACRTVEHPATVTATEWRYVAHVDRNTMVHESGWSAPGDAFDVANQGPRFHHFKDVLDHYDTEHYTETVKDPDTCVTTPRVCTPVPRTCTNNPQTCTTTPRSCTSNKNGSATCSGGDRVCSGGGQTCTGGGESCSGGNQQCTPHSHEEGRTRQVPVYRKEPVNQDWYEWNVWRWIPNRDVPASGTDAAPEAPGADKIALGERERVRMELTCSTTFTADDDHKLYPYKPADCDTEFRSLAKGTRKVLLVSPVGDTRIKPASQK